jgi:hypothetical protein
MVLAADYPFLDILWTMIIFFAWVAWIWILIVLLTNVFTRKDIGGWGKAGWTIFMIVLPFVGVLTYLISQHDQLAEAGPSGRATGRGTLHNGSGARTRGPAEEIATGKQLLDSGTITQAEFDTIKANALPL